MPWKCAAAAAHNDFSRKERTDICMNKYRDFDNYLKEHPTPDGWFGKYGGNFLEDPELIKAFNEYAEAYYTIAQSAQFISELRRIRRDFQGRPTPVYHCQNLSNYLGRFQIYLKREDLNHTGAHKLNHCMGEGLLAKFMGKKKLIAETGAGQHGVALATAAAYFGMECDIYMGEVDIAKQAPNVTRMKMLGANVIPVSFGLKTLKEAVDAAFMAYAKEYKDAVYCIGTAAGPHPFPLMVRDFQYCIGEEAREQFVAMTGHLPDKGGNIPGRLSGRSHSRAHASGPAHDRGWALRAHASRRCTRDTSLKASNGSRRRWNRTLPLF